MSKISSRIILTFREKDLTKARMTAKVACPIKTIVNLHIHSPMSCVFSFFVEASRSVSTCATLVRTVLCPFTREKVRSPQGRVKLGKQGIIIRLEGG